MNILKIILISILIKNINNDNVYLNPSYYGSWEKEFFLAKKINTGNLTDVNWNFQIDNTLTNIFYISNTRDSVI